MNKDLKEKLIKKLKEAKIPTDVKIPAFYLRIQNIINNCPAPCLEYLEVIVNEDTEKFHDKLRIHQDINFRIIFNLSTKFSDVLFQNMRNYNTFPGKWFYEYLLAIDMFANTDIIYSYLEAQNIMKLNSFQREILFSEIFYNEYLKIPCFITPTNTFIDWISVKKARKVDYYAAYTSNYIIVNEYNLYHSTGYQIYNIIIHELVHFSQYAGQLFYINKPNTLNKKTKLYNGQYCDMQTWSSFLIHSVKYVHSKNKKISNLSRIFYYIATDEIEAHDIAYKKTKELMELLNDNDEELLNQEKYYKNNLQKAYDIIKKQYHIDQLDNNTIQNEYNHAICHLMYNENPESHLQAMIMYDIMNVIICQDYIDVGLTFDEDRFKLETMNAVLEQYGFSKEKFQ